MQEKDQAIQKRAYKLLAYILEHRLDASLSNFQEILDSLLLGVATSMSAAKRYRLKCLKVSWHTKRAVEFFERENIVSLSGRIGLYVVATSPLLDLWPTAVLTACRRRKSSTTRVVSLEGVAEGRLSCLSYYPSGAAQSVNGRRLRW